MKQTVWNRGLYVDFLKQLRLPAIIYAAIALVISLLIPIMAFIMSDGSTAAMSIPTISSLTPILFFIMFLAPITLVIVAFSFLNKRSASDYYHSLPNTRWCTYLSAVTAVLTWLYLIIIVTILLTTLTFVILGLPFNANHIPYLLYTFLSGVTLLAGVTTIAVSITGTFFSNLVVTMLILFLPRFITSLYAVAVQNIVPIANVGEFGMLVTPDYNVPVAILFGIFGSGLIPVSRGLNDLMIFDAGLLYTFVLGVIYLILAAVLFRFRRSETAGKSAPNRVMQHIYRCAVTLPVLLILAVFFATSRNKEGFFGDELVVVIVCIVASLLIYLIYELITTKRFKKLWKTLPIYLVLVAFSGLFAIGIVALSNSVLHVTPAAEEIEDVSVSIRQNGDYDWAKDYTEIMQSQVRFDEPEMKELLAENLAQTVSMLEEDPYYFMQNSEKYMSEDYTLHLKDGGEVTRTIYMPMEAWEEVTEMQFNNAAYKKAATAFPEGEQVSALALQNVGTRNENEVVEKIWESYKQEFAGLSNDKQMMIKNLEDPYSTMTYDYIIVTGSVGMEGFRSSYPITNLMPKTAQLYVDYLAEDMGILEKQLQAVKDLNESELGETYVDIALNFCEGNYAVDEKGTRYDLGNANFNTSNVADYDEKEMFLAAQNVAEILLSEPLKPAKAGENSVGIVVSGSGPLLNLNSEEEKSYYNMGYTYLSLSEKQVQQIFDRYSSFMFNQATGDYVLFSDVNIVSATPVES